VLGDGDGLADPDGTGEPDPDGTGEPDPDGTGEPDPDGLGEPEPDGLGEPEPDGTGEPTGGGGSTGVVEGPVPGCGPDGRPPWPTPRLPVVDPCEGCGCAMARYRTAAFPVRGLGPRPCLKPGVAWARPVEPADGANVGRMLFFPELA
jgi:hypothetical protein